jgi:hypothetical protein
VVRLMCVAGPGPGCLRLVRVGWSRVELVGGDQSRPELVWIALGRYKVSGGGLRVDGVGRVWLELVGGGQGRPGQDGGGLQCEVCLLHVAGRLGAVFGGVGNDIRGCRSQWRCLGSNVGDKGESVVSVADYREVVGGRVVWRKS